MPPPQPHSPADLVMQGTNSLGQGIGNAWQQAREETRANQPIHPALQKYIERLMAGEDPIKLGNEARSHPDLASLIDSRLKAPQQPAAANVVPDVGFSGGAPSVLPPGQLSPSGGPQGPAGQSQMQRPVPQGQSLGALPPVNYEQGGVQVSRPAAPPEQAPATSGPIGGYPNQQQSDRAQQFGRESQSSPSQPITNRQFGAMAPMLPAMAAGQNRMQVAQIGADARRDAMALSSEKQTLLAVMKENGLTDRDFAKTLLALEGMDDKQQVAALRAMTDMAKARIGADATVRAAGQRASSQENPAEKELRTLEGTIGRILATPDWSGQPNLVAELNRMTARIGELQRDVGRSGPSTAPPMKSQGGESTKAPEGTKPAPAKKPGAPTKDAKITRKAYSPSQNKTYHFNAAGEVVKTTNGKE